MKLPYLQQIRDNKIRQPLVFEGLNRKHLIKDTELSEGENLGSENLPELSPRFPREDLGYNLANPYEIFLSNERLAYIDGTDFYYDGVVKGTVIAGEKSLVDFNGKIVIFPDKKYYDYVSDTFGTFTVQDGTTVIDLDFGAEHMNRVFAIKGNNVRATKLGDIFNWSTFEALETDSWATDVYSEGDFTGMATFQNHIVLFKDDFTYELYGAIPSQFRLQEVFKIGCIDNKSIKEVNGVLYFLARNGVYAYAGGMPRLISENLNETYKSGIASTDGRRYYLSVDNGEGKRLYVFDTLQNTWIVEDNLDVISFTNKDKKVYALTSDGKIYKFNSGNEVVTWRAETKEFDDMTFKKKVTSRINLRLDLEAGSSLSIYVSVDGEEKKLVKSITDSTKKKALIQIPLRRANTFKIFLEGVGNAKVYGEREFVLGSDI